jgi:hypothetical protein
MESAKLFAWAGFKLEFSLSLPPEPPVPGLALSLK